MKQSFPRKIAPWILFTAGISIIVFALIPSRYSTDFDISRFGSLPTQAGGRIKPLNTIAGNSLLILSNKQTIRLPGNYSRIDATTWLMDLSMRPEIAHGYPVFRIDNSDILATLGLEQNRTKRFSFNELYPHLNTLRQHTHKINPQKNQRNIFEQHIDKLFQSITLYNLLSHSFSSGPDFSSLESDYTKWQTNINPGIEAMQKKEAGESFDADTFNLFTSSLNRHMHLADSLDLAIIPPSDDSESWLNIADSLLATIVTGELNPILTDYAKLAVAYRDNDPSSFNNILDNIQARYKNHTNPAHLNFELFFNNLQPFFISIILYVFSFIIICLSWSFWPHELRKSAFLLLLLAFSIHSFGLAARMFIQARPPVTNLYSSAVFVGWGGVVIGLFLERFHKNGLGAAIASIVGFLSLIIAHNLGLSGDTLEMMQAVLDSNFWLTTHVVVITFGYSTMFLAGGLGIFYTLGQFLPKGLPPHFTRSLTSMTYGVIAFATLFSFLGTMLGGIWADRSWGRFWGWDPKENGALLIVLWCAIMLHVHWRKLVSPRSFMAMAVFGNVVTSWSWFGTNILGVGLHSYGFMNKTFLALTLFMSSQMLIIALAFLPKKPPFCNQ